MKVRRERGQKSYTLMLLGTGENTGAFVSLGEAGEYTAMFGVTGTTLNQRTTKYSSLIDAMAHHQTEGGRRIVRDELSGV